MIRAASIVLVALAFAGCASTTPPSTPHTAALAGHLEVARAETTSAQASAARVGLALAATRTNSERIDAKTAVILRWLK